MPQALPYQLLIYVLPSANKEEIASSFPYKDTDHPGIITNQVLIHLAGYLYEEQTNWLRSRRDEGKIIGWEVHPLYGYPNSQLFIR